MGRQGRELTHDKMHDLALLRIEVTVTGNSR